MGPTSRAAVLAEQLKEDGNLCFKKQRFGAAIDAYTEAITLCPNVAIYWSNRAVCHRKRGDWKRVEEDCRRAIALDHRSLKGHYLLGLALLQRGENAEGIKKLQRSLDLETGVHASGNNMVEEIWQELSRQKYLCWEYESTHCFWKLQRLKQACETALKEKHFRDAFQKEGFIDETGNSDQLQLQALGQVFAKAAEDLTPSEIPDYLCCKITLEIFRDPVIAPSGITYERSGIQNHLNTGRYFDPVTRTPLLPSELVPNLSIKEAVKDFLDKHGWAYKMD